MKVLRYILLSLIFINITFPSQTYSQTINWQESQGLSGIQVLCLAKSPFGYFFAGTLTGIYRSTDNGITWNKTITPDSIDVISMVINSRGHIFAACPSGGILKSTDNGNSWQLCGLAGISMYSIGISKNGILFGGAYGYGVYRSTDNGLNWNSIMPSGIIFAITIDSYDRIYVGGYGTGVFRSTDFGNTWNDVNNGLLNHDIKSISLSPIGNLYVGTDYTSDTQGLYLSTDGGNSWTKTGLSIPPSVQSIVFNSDGHLFLIGPGDGLRRSTDNGISWELLNAGLTNTAINCIMLDPSEGLIIGTPSGIFYTTSSTLSNVTMPQTTSLSTPLNGSIGVSKNTSLSWNSSLDATSYRLQISTDSNFASLVVDQSAIITTWFPVNNLANNITYYWRVNCNNAGGVSSYSSVWSFTTKQTFLVKLSSNPATGGIITGKGSFENGDSVTVTATPNTGFAFINWTENGTEISKSTLYTFIINANKTIVANFLDITSVIQESGIPTIFDLSQNYPNPFNPTTTINYSVPKSGFVKIKIFDVLGHEVETLVNENKLIGNYSVQFNASKLISGVYFYRMEAGGFVQTKKLILIK